MKRLLFASCLLNAVLAGTLIWLARQHPPAGGGQVTTNPPAAQTNAKPAKVAAAAAPAAEVGKPAQSLDWRMVESEDYKKYIANLRAIGCPEETIRDIITADVNKLFASRRAGLNASTNKFEFWKAGNMFAGMMDPDRIEKTQELSREKRALLKELLGVEPAEKPDMFAGMNPFESMLDFLSPAKQNQVTDVFMKYQAKMAKAFSSGAPDADDMKQLQKTQKEMETELAGILTPGELEDYQLRMSQTATMMRFQLASFAPSEQEFRDIFKVKKQFDDQYGLFGAAATQDKAERDKYKAAQKEMEDQMKGILGDTRYTDYERAQDWNFQSIYRVAEKNGLPKDSAVKIYDMKKAAEDQAQTVRQDKSLTPEQRTTALQGIRTETENSMHTTFGDKAWNSYQSQAYWLKGISPDPKPAE